MAVEGQFCAFVDHRAIGSLAPLTDLRSIMLLGGIRSDRFNDPGRTAAPICVWCHIDEARSSNSSLNIRCGECLINAPNCAGCI